MPTIPYPDVPKAPGVPDVPRAASSPSTAAASVLSVAQSALWRMFQTQSQWGIFDKSGKALADPSAFTGMAAAAIGAVGIGATLSTGSVDYSKDTRVSDFPLEGGKFASYNKVETAATPKVVLYFQGSEKERKTFLEAIDKACKSTDVYNVVTPEVTYMGYALEKYNYSRQSSKGATLLIVEISLKEIRQVYAKYAKSEKSQVDAPKDAAAAPSTDNGKVQAKPPETSTLKSLANKSSDMVNNYLGGK